MSETQLSRPAKRKSSQPPPTVRPLSIYTCSRVKENSQKTTAHSADSNWQIFIPQIEVAFDIDANGILNVSAKDLGTGKQQSIEIKSSSGLNEDEIQKMQKEAESHAEEDKKKREVIDLKNQADQLIYATEKTLKEHGEKVSQETRGNIENAVNNLKEAIKGDDADAIKKATEALGTASQELGKVLYEEAAKKQASSASAGQSQETSTPPPEDETKRKKPDDVIDAEFEAKDK